EEGVRERKLYPVPDHAETLVSLVTDEEARYNTVEYQVKHRHKELKTLADYRKSLTGQLASAMLQARLNEIRQQPQPPFSFSYMGYRPMSRTKDAFSMTAFVAEDKFMEGFRAIMVENERARRYGFTQTELERQKKSWMVSAEKSVKEADKVESTRLTWKFVRNYLSNTPAVSAEDRLKLGQLLMPIITLRDINQMYQSWQSTESQVVTMIGNGKAENMPEEAEILSFLKGLELMELAPYEDEAADKPLMAAKPAPGKIVGRKDISELGVTTLYLGNGIKAILKPTNFKNDEILMSAYSTGGSSLYPDQDFQSASYAAPITSSSGLGPYSNVQLQKYMSDKVASVRPYIGEIEEGFRGSCAPKDLELLFQMIHLYMTEPPRDDEAFRSFIAQQMAFMQNRFANPNVWFNNEVLKALYQNHPRRRIMGAEDLERTHPERVHTVFLERFSRPEGFTFVFVGNFEVEQMEQMLKKYLASVPAKGKTETFKNVNASPVSGQVKKEFRKGKEPKSAVSIHYKGKMDWSLRNRWHMNAMTMVLRIMLRESLREDLGGVYGVSVRASPSRFPVQAYDISISFQCAPENVPKLVTSVKQQIASLQSGGPSEANLQKVKETQRKSYEVGIKENRTWLSYLKFYDSNELDPMLLLSTLDRVDALTAGEVQNAAKRYLNGDNYFEAVLLPEETSDK
ncbi:MAG: insulinase family protein, partial [Bacteroidota bacterium]